MSKPTSSTLPFEVTFFSPSISSTMVKINLSPLLLASISRWLNTASVRLSTSIWMQMSVGRGSFFCFAPGFFCFHSASLWRLGMSRRRMSSMMYSIGFLMVPLPIDWRPIRMFIKVGSCSTLSQ